MLQPASWAPGGLAQRSWPPPFPAQALQQQSWTPVAPLAALSAVPQPLVYTSQLPHFSCVQSSQPALHAAGQMSAAHTSLLAQHWAPLQPLAGNALARLPQSGDTCSALDQFLPDNSVKGALPAFARHIAVQNPPPGPFAAQDLQWQVVMDDGRRSLAAAFSMKRMDDFLEGEAHAGSCRVDLHIFKKATEAVLFNHRGACVFAAPKKKDQQQRKLMMASAAPQPCVSGTEARRNKLQRGTTCKLDCGYHFFAKEYAKRKGLVVIKFPCKEGDTVQSCTSMQHRTPAGLVAHTTADAQQHLREYTAEMRELVIGKLKAHIKSQIIRAGMLSEVASLEHVSSMYASWQQRARCMFEQRTVRSGSGRGFVHFAHLMCKYICADVRALVRDKLSIDAGTPAQDIADKVNNSVYAKDYYMDKDYVRNLRVKHVDILWRLRARDVDSMQLLVRTHALIS